MFDAFEKQVDDLLSRLKLDKPRAGSDRLWPGLSEKLQTAPQWLGIQTMPADVRLVRPGVAEVRWLGADGIIGLYVSSNSGAELRRAMVRAALISTHAPPQNLRPWDTAIGDTAFTLADSDYFFARGNLGAMVRSEIMTRSAADIAKLLDDAIQKEKTIDRSALAGMLPTIADLRASRPDLQVGETARLTLTIDPAWVNRTKAFFDYSTGLLNADFPEEHIADLTGVEAGNAKVYGCAVEKKTLLSASKMVAITVKPGAKPATDEETEEVPDVD